MNQRTFLLSGGPYHMHHPKVTVNEAGEPPPWLHVVEPVGTLTPDSFRLFLDHLEVAIYERQQRPMHPGGPLVWYYSHWTPPESSKPPE